MPYIFSTTIGTSSSTTETTHVMTEGMYPGATARQGAINPRYSAFEQIFGQPPPPGRIPQDHLQRGRSSASLRKMSQESLAQPPTRSVSHFMRRRQHGSSTSLSSSTTKGGRVIPHRLDQLGLQDEPREKRSQSVSVTRKASSSTISSMTTMGRSTIVTTSRKEPLVYPALLSRVALKLGETLVLSDHMKNELLYKSSFTGAEAVDAIAYIIKTPDRNLALLLGRALDAQKYFHDVTYDNRLRDSPNEVYQFDEPGDNEIDGVFTLLADCYSPTCTRDKLCYSISCPRRLEQQARLNMKLDPGLQNEPSLSVVPVDDEKQKLWIQMVSTEVAESVPKDEQRRQEAICELIYTERDFVKDLEYLRDFWIKPLRRSTGIIPEPRKEKFIRTMFLNVLEVHAINIKFAEALTRRQQQNPIINEIADIVLDYIRDLEPFVRYGSMQRYGKHEYEREKLNNPAFAKFVEETERLPESRNLEINGYLSKPTTRLARYPLLLNAILKKTPEDNPDFTNITQAIEIIREVLGRLNAESGKTENRFQLTQLNQSLAFRAGEYVDLKLQDDSRQLVYDGDMTKRPGEGDLHVYLFDHAILIVKSKNNNKRGALKVHSKPIPLELLRIRTEEGPAITKQSTASLNGSTSSFRKNTLTTGSSKRDSFPITFQHIGRRGYEITLYAPTFQARRAWLDEISKQQTVLRKNADVYTQHILQSGFFGSGLIPRISCAKPMDSGRKILYGNVNGIYMSEIKFTDGIPKATRPEMVVQTSHVTQISVLDVYNTLLYLSDKTVASLNLELLEDKDPVAVSRKAKHISSGCNFYEVAECSGRTLLTVIRSNSLSSTVRTFEPSDIRVLQQKRPPLRRLLSSQQAQPEGFKAFKPPVEVPSSMVSISYLRSHLCLGCSKGFELLDLNTMKIESLLDPADTSLDFAIKKDSLRPISIYRINKEFLLNYSDFSFFINGNGWRSKSQWIIQWESCPQQIVLCYPYLIGFEPNFIEIRTMNTDLLCAIPGHNIRFLHESTHEIIYVHENEHGQDEVVSLNFWEKQKKAVEQQSQSAQGG